MDGKPRYYLHYSARTQRYTVMRKTGEQDGLLTGEPADKRQFRNTEAVYRRVAQLIEKTGGDWAGRE